MAEDLTVIVANLGQVDYLRPCLKSLFETAADISLRVIVGFNFEGESDTPRAVAAEFPQVEQLRAQARLGYCRAYNELMARSTGRYVLLLDDDTILRSGTIAGLVRFMDAHPEVGIAGCRTTNPDGSYQKSTALMYSLKTEVTNVLRPAAFWRDGIDESVTTWRTAGWLNGHFLMVRAAVVNKVGGLDERFYTLQCEADWCLRIYRAGWKVAYVPDFEVMHAGGAVVGPRASRMKSFRLLMRGHINRYYFIRKHYGNVALHVFRILMSLGATIRLAHYVGVWLARPSRRGEAGPRIEVFWKIMLLGGAARPDSLPAELQRENAESTLFRLEPLEVKPARVPI